MSIRFWANVDIREPDECCNPRHLRTGTQQDNVNDMIERGRQPLGSDRGNSKLSASDVLEIRRLCAEGYVQREVAERFGINQSVVSQIVTRQIWTHV